MARRGWLAGFLVPPGPPADYKDGHDADEGDQDCGYGEE